MSIESVANFLGFERIGPHQALMVTRGEELGDGTVANFGYKRGKGLVLEPLVRRDKVEKTLPRNAWARRSAEIASAAGHTITLRPRFGSEIVVEEDVDGFTFETISGGVSAREIPTLRARVFTRDEFLQEVIYPEALKKLWGEKYGPMIREHLVRGGGVVVASRGDEEVNGENVLSGDYVLINRVLYRKLLEDAETSSSRDGGIKDKGNGLSSLRLTADPALAVKINEAKGVRKDEGNIVLRFPALPFQWKVCPKDRKVLEELAAGMELMTLHGKEKIVTSGDPDRLRALISKKLRAGDGTIGFMVEQVGQALKPLKAVVVEDQDLDGFSLLGQERQMVIGSGHREMQVLTKKFQERTGDVLVAIPKRSFFSENDLNLLAEKMTVRSDLLAIRAQARAGLGFSVLKLVDGETEASIVGKTWGEYFYPVGEKVTPFRVDDGWRFDVRGQDGEDYSHLFNDQGVATRIGGSFWNDTESDYEVLIPRKGFITIRNESRKDQALPVRATDSLGVWAKNRMKMGLAKILRATREGYRLLGDEHGYQVRLARLETPSFPVSKFKLGLRVEAQGKLGPMEGTESIALRDYLAEKNLGINLKVNGATLAGDLQKLLLDEEKSGNFTDFDRLEDRDGEFWVSRRKSVFPGGELKIDFPALLQGNRLDFSPLSRENDWGRLDKTRLIVCTEAAGDEDSLISAHITRTSLRQGWVHLLDPRVIPWGYQAVKVQTQYIKTDVSNRDEGFYEDESGLPQFWGPGGARIEVGIDGIRGLRTLYNKMENTDAIGGLGLENSSGFYFDRAVGDVSAGLASGRFFNPGQFNRVLASSPLFKGVLEGRVSSTIDAILGGDGMRLRSLILRPENPRKAEYGAAEVGLNIQIASKALEIMLGRAPTAEELGVVVRSITGGSRSIQFEGEKQPQSIQFNRNR